MNGAVHPFESVDGRVRDEIKLGMALAALHPPRGFVVGSVRFRSFVDGTWRESVFDGDGNPVEPNLGS